MEEGSEMRVLVTGGAGFIGSHLVDALLVNGDTVIVLDDLSNGSMGNLKNHMNNPAFRFIQGDITDAKMVKTAVGGVDAIIHEAAKISVPLSIENPELVHSVNVDGTLALLKASLNRGVKRFVYASSCAVYGEQAKLPISEDAPPKPLSPYASSKLMAEQSCQTFYELEGLETVCLRYFNVYGPRQTGGEYAGVMIKFLERLRNNQPPIIHGDGGQTRDFVHVSDVVDATLLALERDVAGKTLNIGTGEATSINELCEIFLRAAGNTRLKPIYGASRSGDIRHSQADITKAGKLLGFKPKISPENGVGKLLS
jgi:UDP-glucose 4-epimerase